MGGIGAIVGATAGAVGGFIQAHDAKRQQRLFAHRQRAAVADARKFADAKVESITNSKLFQGAQSFLEGTFGDAASTPLAQDFATGIRQAQAARGLLFGGAAISQEASGLAAFSQQLKAGLLPEARAFIQLPEQLRQSILGFEAPLRVSSVTGAPLQGIQAPQILQSPLSGALTQGVAGGLGGFQIGQSFGGAEPAGDPLEGGLRASDVTDSSGNALLSQEDAAFSGLFGADAISRLGGIS